jgi:hypothetical protein
MPIPMPILYVMLCCSIMLYYVIVFCYQQIWISERVTRLLVPQYSIEGHVFIHSFIHSFKREEREISYKLSL